MRRVNRSSLAQLPAELAAIPLALRAGPYLPALPAGHLSRASAEKLRQLLPAGKTCSDKALGRVVWHALLARAEFEEQELEMAGMQLKAMVWRSRRNEAISERENAQAVRRGEYLLRQGAAENRRHQDWLAGERLQRLLGVVFWSGPADAAPAAGSGASASSSAAPAGLLPGDTGASAASVPPADEPAIGGRPRAGPPLRSSRSATDRGRPARSRRARG